MAALSLKERYNKIVDKGPDKWLSRTLPINETEFRSRNFTSPHPPIADGVDTKPAGEQEGGGQERPQSKPELTFQRGQAAPDRAQVRGALGSLDYVYDNAVQQASKQAQFGNKNLDYARSNESVSDIQNFAGHALLNAARHQRQGFEGAGSKALSHAEVQGLRDNEERNIKGYGNGSLEQVSRLARASRPLSFTPQFVEATWNIVKNAFAKSGELPDAVKKFGRAGITGTEINPSQTSFFYQADGDEFPTYHAPEFADADYKMSGRGANRTFALDEEGNKILKSGAQNKLNKYNDFITALEDSAIGQEMRGKYGAERARIMWKLYLEQGGRDALSGMPLNLNGMQLEHLLGFQTGQSLTKMTDDEKNDLTLARDSDNNFVLINKSVNNAKSDLAMEEFYETQVRPLYEVEKEKFDFVDDKLQKGEEHNQTFVDTILPLFFDADGGVMEGANLSELIEKVTEAQDRINELKGEVTGLYPARDRKPGKKARRGESPEDFQARVDAYEGYTPADAARRAWVESRAGSFGTVEDRLMKSIISRLGLDHTWARKGTEESTGDRGGITVPSADMLQWMREAFAEGADLEDYKGRWGAGITAAKAARGTGVNEFRQTLQSLQ